MKIILPFRDVKKYPLTQRFGAKFYYGAKLCTHQGIDYAMSKMTQLIAPFDGTVRRITPERTTGYGKAVYMQAKDGKIGCLMAHLNYIAVREGERLKMGNNVGFSGRSGFWRGRNGYHLHFGLSKYGKYFDPLPFLKNAKDQADTLFNQDDAAVKSFLGKYKVLPGDNLWSIAESYYGHGGHFMEIFNANEDILKSPNLIHPGDVLRIPALKNKGI